MGCSTRIIIWFFMSVLALAVPVLAEGPGKAGKGGGAALEEITVTAERYAGPATPVDTQYGTQYNVVTEEQIREQNSYDLPSALRDVPGVMSQSKNMIGSQTSHSIYIRGRGASHPGSDLVIEFDGAPRFGALFGQVLADGIPVTAIGGIEIFKSPEPVQFGNGYALINILPKYLTKEGQEAVLNASAGSYRTYNESLSTGVKKGPFDIYAAQSRLQTQGNRANSGSWQQNYYANTGYQLTKEWNIRVLANYVKGSTDAPMPNKIPTATNGVSWPMAESFDTETFFGTLTLNNKYEYATGYIKAYLNRTDFDLVQEFNSATGQRYGGVTGGLKSRQEIRLQGFRGRETFTFWKGGEIRLGADFDMTNLENTESTYTGYASPGINGGLSKREWDFPDTWLFSPYGAISQTFGRPEGFHLTASTGGRYYDHNEFKSKSAGQAGVVAGYANTDLRFSYSRGVNYPTPIALMNFVNSASPVPNPSRYWKNIKPEVVDHYEGGVTYTWPKLATVSATAFYDKGRDRFQTYLFGPIPVQFNDPIGDYEIRGLELAGTATPTKDLELFAGATWMQANATGKNRVEVNHLAYTPGFQFQAGARWTFWEKFRLFADMQHLQNLYQGTVSRAGTLNVTNPGSINKLDDITLFNARLSYRFDYKPWRVADSEVFVAVNNIFNQSYEFAKGYPMPGTTVFAGFIMKVQ